MKRTTEKLDLDDFEIIDEEGNVTTIDFTFDGIVIPVIFEQLWNAYEPIDVSSPFSANVTVAKTEQLWNA